MQLTKEKPGIRWLGLCAAWIVLAALLYFHAAAFRDYVRDLDSMGRRGAAPFDTPLKRVCPTMYADAQMWVRHALMLLDGGGPQLRETTVDNAPFGREVHWNSGWAWAIAGTGWLRHKVTGEAVPTAIEQSLAWFNLPVLLLFVIGFSIWTARRAGLGAGLLVAFAMVGSPSFYSGFNPNYVDHHGLISAAALGMFLGVIFMGGGFIAADSVSAPLLPQRFKQARVGAIMSALSGAFGMWVSAASTIPTIAIIGLAGVLTVLIYGGRRANPASLVVEPELWRIWGRWGACGSVVMYLLEYAPFHLGLRLEVNHPVYAAAWWAGSEMVACFAEWRSHGTAVWRVYRVRLLVALLAIALIPILIRCGGERVFVVFDPFITRLSQYVAEGISLLKTVSLFGFARVSTEVGWAAATLAIGLVALWRSRPMDRPLLVFSLIGFGIFAAMGVAQMRWWPSVSGPEICVLVVALSSFATLWRPVFRWLAIAVLILGLCLPPAVERIRVQLQVNQGRVIDRLDAVQPLFRDIASVLRASQPTGDIVLLSNPNASTAISYYGEFKSIGTLYWENLAGTKAAAEIFSAQSESEGRRLVRARHITHIAMVSNENFLAEYFRLLYPDRKDITVEKSFGYQLLVSQQIPLWLEVIPYALPPDLNGASERVTLLRTLFVDPRAEEAFESALIKIEAGQERAAEADVDRALALASNSAEFWLIKGRLQLLRGDPNAATAVEKAIKLAPAGRRLALYFGEGNRFYREHQHRVAVSFYREALAIKYDAMTANNLVWLLATSSDDSVRNGPEALKLAERTIQDQADFVRLTAYAAALAECGRFDDAVTATLRALELAQAAKDGPLIEKAKARLALYRSGRPYRE